MRTFILDTNIVIKMWNDNSYLFDLLDNNSKIDYRITNHSLCELTRGCGEIEQFFPKVSDKYKRLIKHMINNNSYVFTKPDRENMYFKKEGNEFKTILGNMISSQDYSLIFLCQNNPTFTLVTNDKKMLKSGKMVLQSSQLMDYESFLKEITKGNKTLMKSINKMKGQI